MLEPDEVCEECDQMTLVKKASDHDDNIVEYHCRNRYCNADWIEYV